VRHPPDSTGTYDYLTDALGSTVALTDSTGASQVEYSYAPYGSMSVTGTTTNSYAYTGREFDGLGIDYYRARYYNPTTGRFLSEDPIGFAGGMNLYAYAANNPMKFRDPFGTCNQDNQDPLFSQKCNEALTLLMVGAFFTLLFLSVFLLAAPMMFGDALAFLAADMIAIGDVGYSLLMMIFVLMVAPLMIFGWGLVKTLQDCE